MAIHIDMEEKRESNTGAQPTIMAYKGSKDFSRWLNELAEAQCLPVTILLDQALRDYGAKHGHRPMPRRIPKRPRQQRRSAPAQPAA